MSIILCDKCERQIDSDEDPECFGEVENLPNGVVNLSNTVRCRWCRPGFATELTCEQARDALISLLKLACREETRQTVFDNMQSVGEIVRCARVLGSWVLEQPATGRVRMVRNG